MEPSIQAKAACSTDRVKVRRPSVTLTLMVSPERKVAPQDMLCQGVLDLLLLDGPLQRARAVNRVESGFPHQVPRTLVEHNVQVALPTVAALRR